MPFLFRKYTLQLLPFLALLNFNLVKADHNSGAYITYECVGPNQYKVTLKRQRDCSGSTVSGSGISFSNDCGLPNPALT
jgi:hypothetical protein